MMQAIINLVVVMLPVIVMGLAIVLKDGFLKVVDNNAVRY